ncbi:hypothetical protein EV683_1204 [Crenobacter luteus]|uniref:hypothetical protein n=1 Tax=Crenobacter luteus TaxID=1452487 RepID=UPI0010D73B0C|nr:hypothetical protein [Crenobacter luteus]TCP10656.1 hypothetical protein EV683_1204 [Crenobacter luteus]
MPTIISNVLLRKLVAFPSQAEAIAYARQKLAEGARGVNVAPHAGEYQVNIPVRLFF